MSDLDVKQLADDMLSAFESSVKKDVSSLLPSAKTLVSNSVTDIATNIVKINDMSASGQIDDATAKTMLDMQTESAKMQLLTLEGFSKITLENALNAAFDAVKSTVNTAIGFALL